MRTTERTLDTLRSYRVPSPSEMQEIYLDLRDLDAMERERDELRAELAEWKAAFKVDDREGDSRLMATAMGQALDAAVRERDRCWNLFEDYGQHGECCQARGTAGIPCTCGYAEARRGGLDAAIGG